MDAFKNATIEDQLSKVTGSKQFARSPVTRKILEFIVKEALADRGEALKEVSIAQQVYGVGAEFDPRLDRRVSTAVIELRKKLAEYYQQDGKNDPWVIEVPTGGFVPVFHLRPEVVATSYPVGDRLLRPRHRWVWGQGHKWSPRLTGGVIAALVVAIVLWALVFHRDDAGLRVTNPADGAVVGSFTDVTVEGWTQGLNHYLVVEPIDDTGQRWVQFKVEGRRWTRVARFGQTDTTAGTRFRVYVLSTKSELPNDELKVQPEAPIESPAITVTLRK